MIPGVVRAPEVSWWERSTVRATVSRVLRRETSPWKPARLPWRDRARWALAGVLNRSSRTCWPDLVGWAMASRDEQRKPRTRKPLREVAGTQTCQRDALKTGVCYCGKFRRDGDAS